MKPAEQEREGYEGADAAAEPTKVNDVLGASVSEETRRALARCVDFVGPLEIREQTVLVPLRESILSGVQTMKLGDVLSGLYSSNPALTVVLDFRNVEHASYSTVGMLAPAQRIARHYNGKLQMKNVRPKITEAFREAIQLGIFDTELEFEENTPKEGSY